MKANTENRIIAINLVSSAIQVIVVGLVYFLIYRKLLITLGIEMIGIWSLIIASASISGLANFGFQSAIIKYVAEFNAKGEPVRINCLLFTSILSIMVIFIFIALIIYFLAYYFLPRLIEQQYLGIAMLLLPITFLYLFFNSLSCIFTSALEGFQRNYVKNFIYSIVSVGYLILSLILIPKFGLVGLAFAQVVQSFVILVISYYFIKRICFNLNFFKWNWDRKIFQMLLNYGYKVQIVSIFQMLVEPVTKILLSRFHGLTTLGFYEMASRFITQVRQILAGMNQVTIPIVSHYIQTDPLATRNIYKKSISFLEFIVFPLFAGIIIFTPHLSKIWIGSVEPIFINCTYILAAGMLVNIQCAPAYFNSLGEGKLNGVLLNSGIVFTLIILSGFTFGKTIPVYGVAIANALSTAVGSIFLIVYYHKINKINFKDILTSSDYIIVVSSMVFAGLVLIFFRKFGRQFDFNIQLLIYFIFIYIVVFIPIAYLNKNFKLLNLGSYLTKNNTD